MLKHVHLQHVFAATTSAVVIAMMVAVSAHAQTSGAPITTVSAQKFIPANYMQSAHHRVLPNATSNGFSLIYRIETPAGMHVIEGTDRAISRIDEIHATEVLRGRSTIGVVANSAKNRTLNLVQTPVRLLGAVGHEVGEISSAEDAILFVPVQTGNLVGKVAHGVGELGVTGVRIAKGAAGTRCSGFECLERAGKDILSGANSLTGKHDVSRRLHAEFGTNSETDNEAYRKEIDRISYADAYTGTAYKFGLGTGGADINYFSNVVTGTGYANNGEFLISYKDAYRTRNQDKASLAAWGVPAKTIDAFTNNPAYTQTMRTRLVAALRLMNNLAQQARLAVDAAAARTQYDADSYLAAYEYIAKLAAQGELRGLTQTTPVAAAVKTNERLIMPYRADYLQWTEKSQRPVQILANAARQDATRTLPEIHIIGTASDEFRINAKRMGVNVVNAAIKN